MNALLRNVVRHLGEIIMLGALILACLVVLAAAFAVTIAIAARM